MYQINKNTYAIEQGDNISFVRVGSKKMNILAYSIENNTITRSDGVVISQPPYLDFLISEQGMKVFTHLDYDLANLLKILETTKEEAQKLLQGSVYLSPYTIKFLARKYISIRKGPFFESFSDANQYIPCDFTLPPLTRVKIAQETCQQVYNTLSSIGIAPKSLSSPGSSMNTLLEQLKIPTIDDMPEEVAEFAYDCCDGNWVEAFKLGHWEKAYDYDINSAYPFEISLLPDIRKGKWEKSDTFHPDKPLAYYKGRIEINPDVRLSPIILNSNNYTEDDNITSPAKNRTPTGSWSKVLTKKQIRFIYTYNLGTFEVKQGWEWTPTDSIKLPLSKTIEYLYALKEQSKGIQRLTIKRAMASIYGKFLQIYKDKEGDSFGDFFNPVYAAEIENNTRLRIAGTALVHDIDPIHVAVDGIITDKPLPQNILGNNLGIWRLDSIGPCICAGTGIVALREKPGTGDFSVKYDWLKEQIEANPEAQEYTMHKLSPVTLQLALATNKFEQLGQLIETTRSVAIGQETKRCYLEQPKNGQELLNNQYDSVPWDCTIGIK